MTKIRLLVMLAILLCSSVLLLGPGVTHSLAQAYGGGAWRFPGITNAIGSTLKNAGVVAFGLLVGTLLTCFDPAAKEQISRGLRSAWKKPSRF